MSLVGVHSWNHSGSFKYSLQRGGLHSGARQAFQVLLAGRRDFGRRGSDATELRSLAQTRRTLAPSETDGRHREEVPRPRHHATAVSVSACQATYRLLRCLLAKRERKDLDAGIEEFDLAGHAFDRPRLPDELIHPRLSNFARAIGAGIGSMIAARRGAIPLYLEANGRNVLSRAQDHMEVAAARTTDAIQLGSHPRALYSFRDDGVRSRFRGGATCSLFNDFVNDLREPFSAAISKIRRTINAWASLIW